MSEKRRVSRKKTFLTAYVQGFASEPAQPCLVRDMSQTGARIMLTGATRIPETFDLCINGRDQMLRVETRWRSPTEVGVALLAKIPLSVPPPTIAKARRSGG